MPEQSERNFWLYVGLVISGLLNLTGMASIVDGLVTWAHFFREIIDVYRTVIREPLAYVGNHIWPFGHIPHWAFDVFVLWSALFLAYNIYLYRVEGKTIFGEFRKEGLVAGFGFIILAWIILPIRLIVFFVGWFVEQPSLKADRSGAIGVLQNFLLILALFVVILFINWQLKKFT
jgi:hypothetical protein